MVSDVQLFDFDGHDVRVMLRLHAIDVLMGIITAKLDQDPIPHHYV
jgi:hypothetical protein